MIIGLDIDNVISDLDKTYLEYFLREDKKKRNKGIINPAAPHITKGMFDWTEEEIESFVTEKMDEMGASFEVIDGARCYIDKLRATGHQVYLLTHRINKYWKNPKEITLKWLAQNGINYDKLIFTQTTDKSAECLEHKVDIMFDDSVSNCQQLVRAGVLCYLFKTRYNTPFKQDLPMVDDWASLYQTVCQRAQPLKVILDTDTYNECDDQFALSYLLKSAERFDVQAVTIAPYSHEGVEESIEAGTEKSFIEACRICSWLDVDPKNKVFKGAVRYLKDAPVPNAAVDKIVEICLRNDKTYILAIGAITNVAMAVLQEPSIVEKMEVVWLGGHSLLSANNLEFNFMQDVEAVRTVFESGVKLTVIPAKGVASGLMTSIYELEHHLKGKSVLCDYLCEVFHQDGYHGVQDRRVIWDISVIAYLINPLWFEVKEIDCPEIKDDTSYLFKPNKHKVTFVNYINAKQVYKDLFKKLGPKA